MTPLRGMTKATPHCHLVIEAQRDHAPAGRVIR
jgi:hypothetical protein